MSGFGDRGRHSSAGTANILGGTRGMGAGVVCTKHTGGGGDEIVLKVQGGKGVRPT